MSDSRSLYVVARSSVCVCLSSVCLSATYVRSIQAIEIFSNVSTPLIPWPSIDILVKFYEDRRRETPPYGGGVKRNVRKRISRK